MNIKKIIMKLLLMRLGQLAKLTKYVQKIDLDFSIEEITKNIKKNFLFTGFTI